jgi:hypothetical protein
MPSVSSTDLLAFLMETDCVLCEVLTEFSYIILISGQLNKVFVYYTCGFSSCLLFREFLRISQFVFKGQSNRNIVDILPWCLVFELEWLDH